MARDRALARSSLYDNDFYSWTRRQAELLRAGAFREVDADLIAEEIDALGRSEAAALRASIRLILMHLLKLRHQPRKASPSWLNTIRRERVNLERSLKDNPGLKSRLPTLFAEAYEDAREEALIETGLPEAAIPTAVELDLAQVRDKSFLPVIVDHDPATGISILGQSGTYRLPERSSD